MRNLFSTSQPETSIAFLLACLALFGVAPHADAQKDPSPRLNNVFPMGGKAGSTIELKVVGQDLASIEGLYFSFPGVTTEVLGKDSIGADPKKGMGGKQPANLQAQRVKVTLPADAPLGIQDVRVVTKGGISNSRAFVVGDLDEVNEQEPNDDTDKAQKIALNSVVNGVVAAGTDVDYYAFTGIKGQRVVVSCRSSSIDSKLHAAVEVYDRKGAIHGLNRNYDGNDALLDVMLPADGEYLVRVFAFTYTQGGIDYFYRLTVSTAPWIDAVFPSVVEPGKETDVSVFGRNLPGGVPDAASIVGGQTLDKLTMKVKAPADADALQRLAIPGRVPPIASMLDGFALRLKNDAGSSNPYLLTYADAPVVVDNGNNDTQETAQKVAVPCEIAGRIEKKGDVDWYTFNAKKGQVVTIEAMGERLGSPLDLYFQLVSDKGTVITEQDDTPESMAPHFSARTDDPPRYRLVAPADTTYFLRVSARAAFTDAGPRHLYTVRIGVDEPDFRIVAMPASTVTPDVGILGQHGSYAFNAFVWRLGGYNGDIEISGEALPPGVSVRPQILSNAQKQAVVVVSAAADAAPFAGAIKIVGTAVIAGKKVKRDVRAASIVWPVAQINTLTVTRLDRELVVAVRGQAPYSLSVGSEKVSVQQGEKVGIPVKMAAHWPDFKSTVQLVAIGLPQGPQGAGMAGPGVSLSAGKDSATITIDTKAGQGFAPGRYTIVLRGQTQPINPKQPNLPPKGGPVNHVQVTPPIVLTVIPKQLGKLTVTPPAKLQPGKQIELTVKFARQYDMPIPLKVEIVLLDSYKGLTATAATIGLDQDEAKLTITAAANASPGATAITVRATAMFDETVAVVHEAKVNVAVGK
jgi:hypothetical protein